jgi:hypothetical protein
MLIEDEDRRMQRQREVDLAVFHQTHLGYSFTQNPILRQLSAA